MPAYYFVDRLLYSGKVEIASHPNHLRDVVKRIAGLKLIEEPEAPLRKRKRGFGTVRFSRERWDDAVVAPCCLDLGAKFAERRTLKDGAQRQFDSDRLPYSGNDLGREQGVSTEGKEIVVNANPF